MDIQKRNQALCDAYSNGETMTSIKERTGISCSQLSRIFKEAGVQRKKYELDLKFFEENKHKSKRQISEETGITIKRVTHLWKIAYGKPLTKGKTDFTGCVPTVDPKLLYDRNWLVEQYVEKRLGTPTIAKMIATKASKVILQIKTFGIELRTVKSAMSDKERRPNREWLQTHYIDLQWSISKCAEEYNCSFDSIYAALRDHNIPIRSAKEQHMGELNEFYGQTHDEVTVDYCREIGAKYGREYWLTGDVETKIEQVRLRAKEIWADPKKRLEQSIRITQLCMNGGCNSKQLLYIRERDNKSFLFRSSWEYSIALLLESCDLVEDWDYETISVPVMQNDGLKNYLIDFEVKWVDGLTTYLECKNAHLLSKESEQNKIMQGREFLRSRKSNLLVIHNIKNIANWLNSIPPDGFSWLSDNRYRCTKDYLELPEFVQEIFRHYLTKRISGWRPPKYTESELEEDKQRIWNENLEGYTNNGSIKSTASNSKGMPGRALIMHYQPHFLEVSINNTEPLAYAFNDPWIIYRSLLQSMEEKEGLSYERLLREINFHFTKYSRTSHFAPGFARSVIRLMGSSGKRIFDPCCGWGGRLIGAVVENCEYSGCELSPDSYLGLKNIAGFIKANVDLRNTSCLDVDWPESDLIFTSPPFYDVEKYIGGNQPWMLSSRNDWMEAFVKPFIAKINSKCILYLDERTRQDFEQVRKFTRVIEVKNKRHPRLKDGIELLCVYDK